MSYENVSYQIPDEDMTVLKDNIRLLEEKVSGFSVSLMASDRQALQKLGDRSLPFTDHAFLLGSERKEILPEFLDMDEFGKDLVLCKQTKELIKMLEVVMERLVDTYIAAGADAYASARIIYDVAKSAAKANKPGAKVVVEELRKRYIKNRKKEEELMESVEPADKKEC
jgi:hypothetical protein